MTSSSSPYAVFKAEELVYSCKPVGIRHCLRLTTKKLESISSSIKKNISNSLRNGLLKNMFSLRLHDMSIFQLFQRQN